jgi:CRISPR/Cas system CSM-associated protein Csm2 small subunit
MSGTPLETLSRLLNVLEAETAALKGGQPFDIHATADAKARLLLELTRKRDGAQGALSPEDVLRLTRALAENAQTLQRHMDAVNAIAGSLADAMRKMDDDGTYGQNGAPQRLRA